MPLEYDLDEQGDEDFLEDLETRVREREAARRPRAAPRDTQESEHGDD